MKKLILMTILFLTLQSSGYINFKGAHFRKLEEGEHYYYILRISPQNKNQRPYLMVAISDFFFLNRLSENDDCNDFVNKFYNYADYASEYTMGFYEIHSKKFIKTSEYMELYNQYLLVYSDEFSDIVYYLTDGTLVCVSAAVVKSPVYIADYHASLSSEYPVKYSTGKTSFFTRLEYQKKAVINKDKIIIKAKKQ